MELYIVDAFTHRSFSGNQAGVALLGTGDFPDEGLMGQLAAELKHSETAFVRRLEPCGFHIRYFTPAEEVDLCGHATIAAFTALRRLGHIAPGAYQLTTRAGPLDIEVSPEAVWMDMAPPKAGRVFAGEEAEALYAAYGLSALDAPPGMAPMAVDTGLCDIMLPVSTRDALDRAVQNEAEVIRLSKQHGVVGVHMFWPRLADGVTAHCRNFAPLYAIPEEAATGTSNGALTYYLYLGGRLADGQRNRFIQGEGMGMPSEILSRLELPDGQPRIRVGGRAVVTLKVEPTPEALGGEPA